MAKAKTVKGTTRKPNPKRIITPNIKVPHSPPKEDMDSNWHIIDRTFWGETRVMEFGNGLLVMASTNQGTSLTYVPNMAIIDREGKKAPVCR